MFKTLTTTLLLGWVLFMSQSIVAADRPVRPEGKPIRLHVVFDNVPYKAGLQTGWGFACLIEGLDKVVLFDAGGNGQILLTNMQRLGLTPEAVQAVVLSHIHGDHTSGLTALLRRNPNVTVYIPESFPASFQKAITNLGGAVETVSGPGQIFRNVYSTGEMGSMPGEQALIVASPKGLIVVTGCAHPDVADMVERAKAYVGKKVYLLMGGFHLGGKSDAAIRATIKRLKALGVQKVAPSHCTGATAIRLFRDAWKDDFIEGGLGAVIEVPR